MSRYRGRTRQRVQAGSPALAGSAALTGSGTLAANRATGFAGTLTLTGSGVLTASGATLISAWSGAVSATTLSGIIPGQFLIGMTAAQIQALPSTGAGWNNLNTQANTTLVVDLGTTGGANQSAARAVGAALRWVHSGAQGDYDKVLAALETVRTWPLTTNGYYQPVYRQMAGWVIAANLIGHATPEWLTFLDSLIHFSAYSTPAGRSSWNTLYKNGWDNPTNHGTLGRASLQAIALVTGNTALYNESVGWMRCYWGDRSVHSTVNSQTPTVGSFSGDSQWILYGSTWAINAATWTPVNPVGDLSKDGAPVADINRDDTVYSLNASGQPVWGPLGAQYFSTAIQGSMLSNILMEANGHPDVWSWSFSAPLRNLRYGYRWPNNWGGRPSTVHNSSIHYWVDALLNNRYALTEFPMAPAAGYSFSYTNWLWS